MHNLNVSDVGIKMMVEVLIMWWVH